MKGIDISSFQKGLSMRSVKDSYDFAILRGGFTGYGANRTKNKDSQFETFYAKAKEIGLPVGAYWYSCADTKESGISEAKYFYDVCLKGKQFEMPVYIDVEEQRWQMYKKSGVTDAIIGFCDTLEKLGFFVGVYSSTYWFDDQIDTKRLNAYTKWVADWRGKKPDFPYNGFDMWQYSERGRLDGVQIDLDIAYKDFPKIIKAAGLNGFTKPEKEPEKPAKKSVHEIAQECIEGLWGNGAVRKRKLEQAGYSYADVQAEVNRILETHYVVKKGDTLTAIARKYKTTVNAIIKLNNITNPDLIYAGQVLRVR